MSLKFLNQDKSIAERVAASLMRSHVNDSDEAAALSSSNEDEAPVVERFDENDYDDFKPNRETTEFRKRTAKLLSEQSARYKGKVTSRKELNLDYSESDSDSHSEYDDITQSISLNSRKKSKVKYQNVMANGGSDSMESTDNEHGAEESDNSNINNKLTRNSFNVNDSESEDDAATDSENTNEFGSDNDYDDDDYDDNDDDDLDESNDNNQQQNIVNRVDRDMEIQKGLCVKNQLNLWERLLELRIHSQKLLTKANQLTHSPIKNQRQQQQKQDEDNEKEEEVLEGLGQQSQLVKCAKESSLNVMKLLEQLLQLQDALIKQNTELSDAMTKSTNRKRSYPFKEPANEDGDDDPIPFTEINDYLQERFTTFRSYRDAVLLKWDDRTKLLVPGAITKKSKANEENYDILKKIQNALINKRLLIRKSQQLKSNQQIQTQQEDDKAQQMPEQNGTESKSLPTAELPHDTNAIKFNADIYDDSDFYHQQLRELIEYKANTNTTSLHEVTKQFIELQKIRQKMKKKVDTRASKGRKLRYVVHKKLINFMAPNDTTTWTNESKDELYQSLFV